MIKTIDEMNFNGFPHTLGAIGSYFATWFAMANFDGMLQTVTLILSATAAFAFTIKVVYEVLITRLNYKAKQAELKARENN